MLGKKIPRELSANFLLGFGQSVNLSASECARCSCITLEEQSSNVCIDEVALLPKELSVPVSKDNTALVSKHERQALIDKMRKFLKAKRNQDKPLEAYQGYQEQENAENKLASLWRKKVVSLALIPPDVCA